MKRQTVERIIAFIIIQTIFWIGGGILIWKLLPNEIPQSICKLAIISLIITPFSNGVVSSFSDILKTDITENDMTKLETFGGTKKKVTKIYGQDN